MYIQRYALVNAS